MVIIVNVLVNMVWSPNSTGYTKSSKTCGYEVQVLGLYVTPSKTYGGSKIEGTWRPTKHYKEIAFRQSKSLHYDTL